MFEEVEEEVTEPVEETVEEAPKKARRTKKAKKSSPIPVPITIKVKRYSFEKWAARRGVKSHHRPGLKAYVKNVNKLRTLEEWDECFKGY